MNKDDMDNFLDLLRDAENSTSEVDHFLCQHHNYITNTGEYKRLMQLLHNFIDKFEATQLYADASDYSLQESKKSITEKAIEDLARIQASTSRHEPN